MPGRVGFLSLLALLALIRGSLLSSPAPEEEAYWWQDELRTVAFDLAASRSGEISRWPRLTVPAGSGTLPLPEVSAREGDDCWSEATTFPVGPVFLPWREGPVTLRVSAFRVGKQAFVRIDSPVDLSGARALEPSGALLTVGGRSVRVDTSGEVDGGTVTTSATGQSIRLELPLAGESCRALREDDPPRLHSTGHLPARATELTLSPQELGLARAHPDTARAFAGPGAACLG